MNNLARDKNIGIDGIVKGGIQISDFYGERVSDSNIKIETLVFNGDTLGDLYLYSDWDKYEKNYPFPPSPNISLKKR